MEELLTKKQRIRKTRDAQVVAAFNELKTQYPSASSTLIIQEMLSRGIGGLTSYAGIRSAILRYTKQTTL